MTEGSRRVDGYVRVSRRMGREGAGYISPKIQQEAIQRWADYRGVEIIRWHVDEDQSGGTQNRPGLREAIARVENGETGGIAVWRLNRFARNVAGAVGDLERIEAAGGEIAFVEEGIDGRGPFGEFLMTILLAVAKLELDNAKSGWVEAKGRAIQRGAKISRAPLGYRRIGDGTIAPDPVVGEHVRRAFHVAASQGLHAALDHLAQVVPERAWTTTKVRRILANRSYLGEARYGEMANTSAHEPLVSRGVWEAAQSTPDRRRQRARYPLSGLAHCATCGGAMIGAHAGHGIRTYRCAATQTSYRGERCAKGAHIKAETLEEHVLLEGHDMLAGLKSTVGSRDTDRLTLAERAVVDAEAELDAFAGDLMMRRALGHRYHEHLQSRVDDVERARGEYRALAQQSEAQETLRADVLDIEGISTVLRSISFMVLVAPGRGDVAGRVSFVPLDGDGTPGIAGLDQP